MTMEKCLQYCLIILVGMGIVIVNADICDMCKCSKNVVNNVKIECIGGIKNNISLELENIQWPTGNVTTDAYFNNLKYTYLPKLLGSSTVRSIHLDNNEIDTITNDPFQYCKNVEIISIVNNSISSLSKDFLKSTNHLRQLNLSHNFLSDIDNGVLSHLKDLIHIDLSYNKLTTVSIEIIALKSVEILNLKGNNIFVVQNNDDVVQASLKLLDLSNNKLTMIATTTFEYFHNLEILDLSNNSITNIEREAFNKLVLLKKLDLSKNKLEDLMLTLPDLLEHVIFSSNHLRLWPTNNLPSNLIHLELQHNKLIELFNGKWFPSNLRTLNISHNRIELLPDSDFLELRLLDLSFNEFTAVPQNMAARAPILETLILDNNPIETIEFKDKIHLTKLSISYMPLLKELDENAFINIEESQNCINLIVSHCPHLTKIHADALQLLDLCKLDISYNALTSIPHNLTDWTSIPEGIDLQGNPFDCTCSAQWMLDIILRQLYKKLEHQHFLMNLRCAHPGLFTGQRFVKYYKRKAAFCNPSAPLLLSPFQKSNSVEYSENDGILVSQGPNYLIIIALCAIVLISLIIVGIYWTTVQQRTLTRKNRRYQIY